MYAKDIHRIEATIPARLVYSIIAAGVAHEKEQGKAPSEMPEEMKVFLAAAEESTLEPLRTGLPQSTAKLARRVERTCVPIINEYAREGVTTTKMTLICYHLIQALIESGVLILHEGTVFAETVQILLKAIERTAPEEFNNPDLDRSARKAARNLLRRLRLDGYYRYAEIDAHLN